MIAIRGPKYDNNSNVFKKLNNQNLIDWTLKELIKSSINKIVIATPDSSVVNYVKKFKSKKIVTFLRSGSTAIINSPIDKIILNSFNKFKIRNRHFDCMMSISIEAPFRNHYDYDSMINVMKIFKTTRLLQLIKKQIIFIDI